MYIYFEKTEEGERGKVPLLWTSPDYLFPVHSFHSSDHSADPAWLGLGVCTGWISCARGPRGVQWAMGGGGWEG